MNVFLNVYLDNNLGDDLMIKGVVTSFPNINFMIMTDNSVVIETYKNYKNVSLYRTNQKKQVREKMDVFLTLGGSVFQFRNYKTVLVRYLKYLKRKSLARKGVKFLTIGSNMGPFNSRLAKVVAYKEIHQCDFVTVRDSESFKLIKENFAYSKVFQYDDIVFELLDKSSRKNLNDNNANAKLNIGITAYRSILQRDKNMPLYNKLSELIRYSSFREKIGKVYLFAFDTENENDLSAAYHISEKLENQGIKTKIVPYLGNNSDTFLDCFRSMDYMIAIRFHGAILSDLYEIPYIPIAYSNKLEEYIKDTNTNQKCITLKNIVKYNMKETSIDLSDFKLRSTPVSQGHLRKLKEFFDEQCE